MGRSGGKEDHHLTLDYFTDSINGRAGVSRKDYTSSADDEVIVKGVADDELALVNAKRVERPDVKAFARYFVRNLRELAGDSGSVPMMGMAYTLAEQRLEKMAIGTMFKAPNAAELGVEYLLTQ